MPVPAQGGYPTSIITLADVKAQLNKTSNTDDAELQLFIDAATDVVEDFVGEIIPDQYTETYDGGAVSISLRHTPVLSVDAVTEFMGSYTWTLTNQPAGQSVDYYGYSLDNPTAGTLTRRGTYSTPVRFMAGSGNVSVTYTAGFGSIPASIQLATRIIVQHLWTTQRGAGPMPLQPGADEMPTAGMGFAIPNRAVELLMRYRQQGGIG